MAGSSSVRAEPEPDGAIAPPGRWTGPEGPPSRSRRSRALPITRDVVEAWSLKLPGKAVSPPVTWDGVAYVLCTLKKGRELVAVDLGDGKVRATKRFPRALDVPIHVWGHVVYVATSSQRVSGYKLVKNKFVSRDRFAASAPTNVCAFKNEIYITCGPGLKRMASGMARPVWSSPDIEGPVAVYGRSIVALKWNGGSLTSLSRLTGQSRFGSSVRIRMSDLDDGRGPGDVALGAEKILLRPGGIMRTADSGYASHVFVSYRMDNGYVQLLKVQGLWSFKITPAVYDRGLLAYDGRNNWQLWKGGRGKTIASRKYSPDLFRGIVPATVLGQVAYFGTWAADMKTGEVLWRLPLAKVRFGAVPGDRIVIVVDERNILRAYRSRVGS